MSLGSILNVNLTNGKINIEEFSAELAAACLGGLGFNTTVLYEQIASGVDPLGPANILALSCGLLTGTSAPASSRIHVSARSPLSGLMGSSNAGGLVGVQLRSLGIQSIVIRGKSDHPVYLRLDEGGAEIADATSLWGLDTRKTEKKLSENLKNKNLEMITIGPAGENRVRYACIMFGTHHSAGRTGLGAVMGSKQLKAIVVQGKKIREKTNPVAASLVKKYVQNIQTNVRRYHELSELGSSGDILEHSEWGLLPTRNYRYMQLDAVENIDGRKLKEYVIRRKGCRRCPVHCKAEIEIKHGKHKGFKGERPEFETVIDIGALCGLTDPDDLLYLSNLCNLLGLDTISTGSVIAFAMDLYSRNIFTTEDTGGLDLTWGNAAAMETLMHQIADRQGFGEILAQGVRRAAERIGKGSEKYAYHVKGVEMYGADPRGLMGTALSYAVSMRGGDFTSVYPVPEFRYTPDRAEKEFGTRKVVDYLAKEGKAALVKKCMLVSAVIDSLGICKVPALSIIADYDLKMEAAFIKALTGLKFDPADLFLIGERIVNMEKLFNIRQGATAADDTLPDKFIHEPIGEGPAKGVKADVESMIKDFYRVMGWDDLGTPSSETLMSLGLEEKVD
jgi:aldehyde:ferredoxin oxidoreductase